MTTAIRVENLSKVYPLYDKPIDRVKESLSLFRKKKYHHNFYALNNVSFEIEQGDTVGIVGKNGSGKSTLLKIITGVLTPTEGKVTVNGKVSALLELGAGFNPEMTGLENVYFNGMIMGYSREEMDRKLDDILSFVDIGEFVNQPVKTYSSGMFVRLAFSVATNVNPEILIVDEALSVGDMFFQAKCMTKMKRMIDNGTTLLFVSHDIGSVKSLCQKALWLQNGSTKGFDDSQVIISAYSKELIENINNNSLPFDNQIENEKNHMVSFQKNRKSFVLDKFKNDDFSDEKKYYRTGTGKVKFRHLEVTDINGNSLNHQTEFNQEILITLFLEIIEECEHLCVVYRIRNKQNEGVLGYNTFLDGTDFHSKKWNTGDCIIVTFKTKLPLIHGNYSIALMVSSFLDYKSFSDVIFHDWVENAYVFNMKNRESIQVFDYVEIFNEVKYEFY